MSNLFYFILLLSILVVAHEWGHYIVARLSGVRVLRFSVGFGPEIFGITRGPTRWSLCAFPFGGFVKFAGDDPEENPGGGAPDEFLSQPVLNRAAIVIAGPAMNFILAILVYAAVLYFVGMESFTTTRVGEVERGSLAETMGIQPDDVITKVNGTDVPDWFVFSRELVKVGANSKFAIDVRRGQEIVTLQGSNDASKPLSEVPIGIGPFTEPVIGFVKHGGPAYEAGLRKGDRVLEVEGAPVDRWSAMRDTIRDRPGQSLSLKWDRAGTVHEGQVTPIATPIGEGADADTVGQIGIQQDVAKVRLPLGAALAGGAERVFAITEQVVKFLPSVPVSLYKALVKGESTDTLGGPVRMAQLSGEAARWGTDAFFSFLALISTQLAIFNLLPIPVLDGGHLALYVVEAVIRRPPSLKIRIVLHQIGFALLVLLLLSVTVMDVGRLFG